MTPQSVRKFWQLARQQWQSPDRLADLQRANLRALIAYVYDRVPYYRRLFARQGLRQADIKGAEDLSKLPVLTRQELQRNQPGDLLADGIDLSQCLVKVTSGSTGRPLNIWRTKPEDLTRRLVWARANFANGLRPWHRQALIIERNLPAKDRLWLDSMRDILGLAKLYLWCGDDVRKQVAALRSYRPHVLLGYSQSLRLLAYSLRQSAAREIAPRIVFSSAELLDERTRALVREVLGVEMVDMYVSVEAGCIAWECPRHHGCHLNTDNLVVEFLRDGKPARPGEPGHVVVTPLFARAMPLLRYDLGDVATPLEGQCPCGRGLPLMQVIQGRADDFVTLRSGAFIYPVGTFADIIEKEPGIVEFLVIQESLDLVVIKLVTRGENNREIADKVRSGVEELLRHEATVKVELVDQIERGYQSKLRRIISKVPVPF
ncbi:MAG: phenylacetate--CoA ligase family protein [Deltaproteobacteria bacterium]|nr:phenylacetate--CoA ligase family protein [Deltaproteobacteria bacterium]